MFVSKTQRKMLANIKKFNEKWPNRCFSLRDIPEMTMHTVIAFIGRGIIVPVPEEDTPFAEYGPEYFTWTGKELE